MLKNKVWYSTQKSRDNQTTSILAIVETIFFVILTWGIAYYFDTYIHIYTAIAIAPFLLLKTPESTEKAIEWFLYEYKMDEKNYYKNKVFWIILTVSSIFSFIISYFFSTQILIHYEGWELFFLSTLLGIILIVGVGIAGVGLGLGLFLRSLFIKFTATSFYTLTHPKKTFFAISKNWNEQITVNDILYTPELLPDIHKRDNTYQLSSFISGFGSDDLGDKVVILSITPIWSLGYLYRFSIKSTAWFFFPLAYLANLSALQDETKKEKAIKTQTWDKLFWFNLIVSAVLFLYFKFSESYLKLLKLSEEQLNFIKTQITHIREYFVPEAMWLLVVAVVLYFIMNTFISRKEHIEDKSYGLFSYWIIKLIYMLWMIFLGWHIVVFTNQYVLPELPRLLQLL
ncbi:MAG: Unknown protein [uncultured Sulfurovum sp.]|uniref:Uncharacterized protein n=1 Tax=uncultured Sulfurovum sp. TaxID=269237 RepID=A0A6S6TW79_9BACT|nr:MAG: Unknown protein [uncultured Sulfurovum sp.]